jgi:putative thioredoxin
MSKTSFDAKQFIYDASQQNFDSLVLKNSQQGPVLVHFWSPKAGPSFRLYPVLEKLVTQYQGRFLLINLNVDENKKLAREYAITSLPTLKLFVNQQTTETLFGYQNESDLKFMLDQYVASEDDVIIQQALQQYQSGEQDAAYQTLGRAALNNPNYYKTPLTIASLMYQEGRLDEALKLLHSMPETIQRKASCKRLLVECEYAQLAAPVEDVEQLQNFVEQQPQELPAVAILAAWYVTQRDYAQALELFHHIMQQDNEFEDKLGRRSIVKIISLLTETDPLLKKYRNLLRTH